MCGCVGDGAWATANASWAVPVAQGTHSRSLGSAGNEVPKAVDAPHGEVGEDVEAALVVDRPEGEGERQDDVLAGNGKVELTSLRKTHTHTNSFW